MPPPPYSSHQGGLNTNRNWSDPLKMQEDDMMKARNPQQYFLRGENIYQNNFLRSDSLIKKPYLSV